MKLTQDKPYYAQMNWKEVENTLIEDWNDCEFIYSTPKQVTISVQ